MHKNKQPRLPVFSLISTLLSSIISAGSSSESPWLELTGYPGPPRHHPITFSNATHGFLLTGSALDSKRRKLFPADDFYVYTEASDTWEKLDDFPGGKRSFGYGVSLGDFGYVGFGNTGSQYLNDLWRYDMVNGVWKELASCPGFGRRHPAMVAIPGKIYVGLGDGYNATAKAWQNFADFWEYDMESDAWTQVDDLPAIGRHHPFYFEVNGQVYAGMGHSSERYGERDWYRLENESPPRWTKMRDFVSYSGTDNLRGYMGMVTSEGRVAGTQGSVCGLGFVLSGDGDNHSTMNEGEFHVYNGKYDIWTALEPHPGYSRWAPGSFVIGEKVYFTSGVNRKRGEVYGDLWCMDLFDVCAFED